MSVSQKAARGAAWTILFGLVARGIGVAGTLVMTHLLAPDVMGEVAAATIVVMVFNWISNWGFGQYLIVKGRGDAEAEVVWHVTLAHLCMGGGAMAIAALAGGYAMPWFNAADGAVFVPGMALAMVLRRIAAVPEKILTRKMQFRAIGLSLAVGESAYTGVSLLLAWRGHGGMSIVYGNIAQSAAMLAVMVSAAGLRSWTTPTRVSAARLRDMIRFGLPLGIESVAYNAARQGDRLLMARYFGPGPMAHYSMAYNLADIPAIYVGEQVGQVLLPSLAELPPERRPAALVRATALISLLIFPMAVGLAVVADSLVASLLSPEWQDVAPLLTILAVLSVFRPITWTLSSYLEATEQTSTFMWLEIGKLVPLFGGIVVLHRWGIDAAAFSVGIAFGLHAAIGIYVVGKTGPSPAGMVWAVTRPLAACGVMAAAVLGARFGLSGAGLDDPRLLLAVEIVVGALSYIVAAFVVARPIAQDFIGVLRQLRRRRAA